jgi:hypothetical protein
MAPLAFPSPRGLLERELSGTDLRMSDLLDPWTVNDTEPNHDHHEIDVPTPFHWNGGAPKKPELLRYRAESLEWLEDALLSPRGAAAAAAQAQASLATAGTGGGGVAVKQEKPKPPVRQMSSAVMEGDELDSFLADLEQFGEDFSERLSM